MCTYIYTCTQYTCMCKEKIKNITLLPKKVWRWSIVYGAAVPPFGYEFPFALALPRTFPAATPLPPVWESVHCTKHVLHKNTENTQNTRNTRNTQKHTKTHENTRKHTKTHRAFWSQVQQQKQFCWPPVGCTSHFSRPHPVNALRSYFRSDFVLRCGLVYFCYAKGLIWL